MRISIYEGAFATIHAAMFGGIFITGLALRWGANTFQIGLLAAIPALFSASGLISALLIGRLGRRKPLAMVTSGIGRCIYLALLPFLLLHKPMPISLYLTTIAVFNFLLVVANNAWTSWMGDLVPQTQRGRYFGLRNTLMSLTSLVFLFLVGKYLDGYKTDEGFAYVCVLGVTSAIVAVNLLRLQPEPRRQHRPLFSHLPVLTSLRITIVKPLADPSFRKFFIFVVVWSMCAPLASPFYTVHMLKNLSNTSYSLVAVYGMISAASGIAFQWLWGRAIDRFRAKPVIYITLFCTGFLPLLWVFATPKFLLPIWLDGIGNGLFWTGAGLGMFSLMLGFAEGKRLREAYFALFTAAGGLANFLASLISATIAQALEGFHWRIGGFHFVNFHVMFILASVGRFSAIQLLRSVPDEGAAPVSRVLEGISEYAVRRLNYGRDLLLEGVNFISRRIAPIRNAAEALIKPRKK